MEAVNRFFEFETKYKLFDFVDEYGLRPWDGIRYYVMMSVLHKKNSHIAKFEEPSVNKRLWYTVRRIFIFLKYLINHRRREFFFLLCSRDKKDGFYYDKIADGIYNIIDKERCFVIESTDNYQKSNYKYGDDIAPLIANVSVRLTRSRYDFHEIYSLLKKTFPNAYISEDEMNNYYRRFVGQFIFYKWLFSFVHIKKVFFVQNAIQKGLIAAANVCKIQIVELQHGQISINHPAYSYPNEDLVPKSKIYHPDYLLTFGSFWSKNRHYPGVKDVVIGNNDYSVQPAPFAITNNKRLLVISNLEEGELLAKRVEEVLEKDPSFYFIFKLHPNQFHEFDFYRERFAENDKVEVVSNQQSINQLLQQCEGIFLNESTVELEALRMGKKVFVLKEQYYQVMDFVFGEKGVYECNDVDDFLVIYEKNKGEYIPPRNDLFSEFKEDVAKSILFL